MSLFLENNCNWESSTHLFLNVDKSYFLNRRVTMDLNILITINKFKYFHKMNTYINVINP